MVEGGLPLFRVRIVMVRLGNRAMETVFVQNISSRARSLICSPARILCHQFRLRIRELLNHRLYIHLPGIAYRVR